MLGNTFVLWLIFVLVSLFNFDILAQDGSSHETGQDLISESVKSPNKQELEKFIAVLKEVNKIKQNFNQSIIGKLEKSGLTVARFNEMEKAYKNQGEEVEATAVEKANFEALIQELKASQQKMEEQLMQVVVKAGFEIERYKQIVSLVNANPELKAKVKSKL